MMRSVEPGQGNETALQKRWRTSQIATPKGGDAKAPHCLACGELRPPMPTKSDDKEGERDEPQTVEADLIKVGDDYDDVHMMGLILR